jgi:hypothetical protein
MAATAMDAEAWSDVERPIVLADKPYELNFIMEPIAPH